MDEKKTLTFDETKEKALRLLEFRSHSEKELSEKLLRAGAERDDLPDVLTFLREYGLVNDQDYAKRLAKDLANLKKYGKFRIRAELKNKGICAEYIEDAMAELADFESDTLLPLVQKRLKGDFDRKNIEKIMRYFTYRGYSYTDIQACIDKLQAETE